jgi:hypothetical protein
MKLEIDDTFLKVKLNPLEMIGSFHGSLSIPLSRIVRVSTEKPGWEWGARTPGIRIPFLVKTGTYLTGKGREFWVTYIGRPYLVIDTEAWHYNRVVLTVGRNLEWAERINGAIQS